VIIAGELLYPVVSKLLEVNMSSPVCGKLVRELAIGDVFYITDDAGLLFGPYTVTKELMGTRGVRNANNHIVTMAPDTQALSERDAIQEILRRNGFCPTLVDAWQANGFDFHGACQWISIGCWDADVAAAFRAAGVKPEAAWHVLNPINSVQCNYTTLNVLIARAQEHQHERGI
jgi:hypothetical protein